jgi:hypothetical protein
MLRKESLFWHFLDFLSLADCPWPGTHIQEEPQKDSLPCPSHGPTFPSSPPLFCNCSCNLSNADHIEDVPMSLNGSSPSAKDDKPIQPKVSIKKRNYDVIRKFQEKWATKLPWAELFVREDGTLHTHNCRVCTKVKGKNKILATKWDSLCKHVIHQKVVKNMGFNVKKRDWFYSNVCKHAKSQITLTFQIERLLMPNWHMEW